MSTALAAGSNIIGLFYAGYAAVLFVGLAGILYVRPYYIFIVILFS